VPAFYLLGDRTKQAVARRRGVSQPQPEERRQNPARM